MFTEFFNKIKEEAIPIFALGISFFLTAGCIHYLIIPQYILVKSDMKKVFDYEKLISSETGYTDLKSKINMDILHIRGKIKQFTGVPLEANDISSFLEILIDKAKAAEISFVRMQPQTETVGQDFTLLPVLLEFSTTYHALGQFLSSLERLPHMFRVNRLAIEAKDGGKLDIKLLITCSIPLRETP